MKLPHLFRGALPGAMLAAVLLVGAGAPRPAAPRVYTTDLDHFWTAYDSIRSTRDSVRQVRYLNRLYLAKGSYGLQAFREVKGHTAGQWVSAIRRYPRFWESIRPRTQLVRAAAKEIELSLGKLKAFDPKLRPAKVYFAVGALRASGLTKDSLVVIGSELATGNALTDLARLPKSQHERLARDFGRDPLASLVPRTVHEYVHTQLNGYGATVLGQALNEGTCTFVAELVTGQSLPYPYLAYGLQHEAALKERFKSEMFIPVYLSWSAEQTPDDLSHTADLGYYLGYAICKAYYAQAINKPQAVRDMLRLDYKSPRAVEEFLEKSQYYADQPLRQLREAFAAQKADANRVRPYTLSGQPVSPAVTELTVDFPRPMSPYASVRSGPGGEATYPELGPLRYSDDNKSLTFPVTLKPGQDYEFIVADGGARSLQDYPNNSYLLKFSTK